MRLIERAWYENHPVKWLLLPLNILFWLISSIRRMAYKVKLFNQPKLPLPVVIVGNIGVGGNGKTPVVIYLVEQLIAKGIKVGVISRGYGGEKTDKPRIVDANSTAAQVGDEPVLIYQRTQVPVVVSPDRVANVAALHQLGCQLVISDDGLQHYKLQRDVELVIVDGKRRFGNGWLMPAGPLREGTWRLDTVDKVIVNGGQAQENEVQMQLSGTALINVKSKQRILVSDFLQAHEKRNVVNALAGIGNPQRFFNTLKALGFTLGQQQGFVDHHHYQKADFLALDDTIPLLMTEKDAVKCADLVNDNTWYLPVDAQFEQNEGDKIIDLIIMRSKKYGL